MSVEQAIVRFVVQGADLASQQAGQVTTDLQSASRAGKEAEAASKAADAAAAKAQRAVNRMFMEVQRIGAAARLLSVAAGASGEGGLISAELGRQIEDVSGLLSAGVAGAAQGRALTMGLPIPAQIAAAVTQGLFSLLTEREEQRDRREQERGRELDRRIRELAEARRAREAPDVGDNMRAVRRRGGA